MLTKEEIGKKIRDLRVKKSISQGKLAKAIGLESHAAISDIEKGKTNLKITQLNKIADFFEMSAGELLKSEVVIADASHARESKGITLEERNRAQKNMKGFFARVEEYKKKK